jgi:hypothetical protein
VSLLRTAGLIVVVTMLASCAPEPTAPELATKAIANLRNAKTAHMDGTGSMAMKTGQAIPFSYAFTVSGDAMLPHDSRTNMQMVVNGVSLKIDTITVAGKDYARSAGSAIWIEPASGASPIKSILGPLSKVDGPVVRNVVEVDRPEIDGRKTRHLRYEGDATTLFEDVLEVTRTSSVSVSNPRSVGELWIRVDNTQIVRQLVTLSIDFDGVDVQLAGMPRILGSVSMDMSIDLHFSRHGEAIPQITAPPTGP